MQLDLIFFFKQKTAYEMRISDWNSDVCSSDLDADTIARDPDLDSRLIACRVSRHSSRHARAVATVHQAGARFPNRIWRAPTNPRCSSKRNLLSTRERRRRYGHRSEEHTSELQSLMRISYAVVCLKKKNNEKQRLLNTKHRT